MNRLAATLMMALLTITGLGVGLMIGSSSSAEFFAELRKPTTLLVAVVVIINKSITAGTAPTMLFN